MLRTRGFDRRTNFILLSLLGLVIVCSLVVEVVQGQYERGRRRRGRRGYRTELDHRAGVPDWELDHRHRRDVFTFCRAIYTSGAGWGRGDWATDYPDSDLNFSYRLQQLTSMQVDPDGVTISLDDPRLLDYPFVYLIEPGDMSLTASEIAGLRRYLLQGGFLMVDDFWGEQEYRTFYENFKRVLPDNEPRELDLSHEVFHIVYQLREKPQIPSIHAWQGGYRTERWDAQEPHYLGVFDENERMMAIICHNTDLGDGWEEEGVDPDYFREYSEKWSYPLGINIVVYAMTH
jgi:hypothetical protein